MGTKIALAEVAGARADVADLGRAPGFHADPGADAVAIAGRSDCADHDPVAPVAAVIAVQAGGAVEVEHQQIEVAIVVEVAGG